MSSHLAGGGGTSKLSCPRSANSQKPDKEIISPPHDIIFPFTRCLNGTLYGFLSHLPFPSLLSFLTPPLAPRPFRAPPSLPVYPFRLVSTILFLLGPSLTLTLTEGLCAEVALVTRSSLPLSPYLPSSLPFLSLSGGKSHTHQFAGAVPDEQARKENINEAPQPINT